MQRRFEGRRGRARGAGRLGAFAALGVCCVLGVAAAQVPFVRTPDRVVMAMLEMANVGEDDVVYDLGSGDGRIVVAAAKEFGARGVGIDIDAERVADGIAKAQANGVSDRVRFLQQDMFKADIREATVVALYLVPRINQKLRPKLLRELAPGTRIVSHNYDFGEDWPPHRRARVGVSKVYCWVVPSASDKEANRGGCRPLSAPKPPKS